MEPTEHHRPACRRRACASPTADRCGTSGRPRGGCRTGRTGSAAARPRARRRWHRRRTSTAPGRRPSGTRSCRSCTSGWAAVRRRAAARRPTTQRASPPRSWRPPRPRRGSRHAMTVATPAWRAASMPALEVLRPDEQHRRLRVAQDVRGLVGVEVEVHRHRARAGEQGAEMCEHDLGRRSPRTPPPVGPRPRSRACRPLITRLSTSSTSAQRRATRSSRSAISSGRSRVRSAAINAMPIPLIAPRRPMHASRARPNLTMRSIRRRTGPDPAPAVPRTRRGPPRRAGLARRCAGGHGPRCDVS